VRLWWEIAKRSYARHSTYRVAVLAGLFTNLFFGFVRAYVLLEVHRHNPDAAGLSPREAVTFVFATQALIAAVGIFGTFELAERVRSGMVAVDLYRPVDVQAYEAAAEAGRAAFQLVARAVPLLLVGAAAFGVTLAPLHLLPALLVSLALAVVVGFAINFLLNLSAFWLLDHAGVGAVGIMTATLLSGLAIPLGYFPAPLDTVTRALPWAAMLQLPVELMVGTHRGAADVALVLARQAAWAVALLALGRYVLRRATRKVLVQGG
jgi:ABC-2 type transport system permease protein